MRFLYIYIYTGRKSLSQVLDSWQQKLQFIWAQTQEETYNSRRQNPQANQPKTCSKKQHLRWQRSPPKFFSWNSRTEKPQEGPTEPKSAGRECQIAAPSESDDTYDGGEEHQALKCAQEEHRTHNPDRRTNPNTLPLNKLSSRLALFLSRSALLHVLSIP